MASSSLRYHGMRGISRAPIESLHLLLLISLSLGAVLWGWILISGQQGGDSMKYLLLLGLYGVASAAFIFSRTKENHLRFFDIPVYLTIAVFVEFGLAPLECFIDPGQLNYNFHGNYTPLLRALLYLTVGMVAFWAGCNLTQRRTAPTVTQEAGAGKQQSGRMGARVLQAAVGLYAVAFGIKVYLFTHRLYSYLASGRLYFNNLASMQVLMVVAGFGTYALIIVCIERYLHPSDPGWGLLFAVIFASECFWGLISGMKGLFLQNFIVVALVSSLIQRRFRKRWIVAAVLGLILLYPISNEYRNLVRAQHEQVTSLTAAEKAGYEALRRANATGSGTWSAIVSGWRSTVARLDLLQSAGLMMSLGSRAAFLQDTVHWWMLPFYPFIPRFIWPSKPILNEGGRFSVALGYGTISTVATSTAVTYPGDLCLRRGVPGVIAGMFLLGIVAQWLTNSVSGALDKRRLFIYAAVFLTATNMEIDSFSYWSSLIKSFAILSAIAFGVYGPRHRPSMVLTPGKKALARS